jgi:hypothetical protein
VQHYGPPRRMRRHLTVHGRIRTVLSSAR